MPAKMHSLKRSSQRLFALSAVIFLLGGCTKVGPDFLAPKVAVSAKWQEADDQRIKSEAADYRYWWKVFDDPVLDRLIDRAYRENLSLKRAGVRVLEARAQLGVVVGQLYPQAQQAAGSLQYSRISEQGFQAASFSKFHYAQDQIAAMASWEIDFWGKFRRAVESADAGLLVSVADYDGILVSLTADVANSYILIRTLENRITIANRNAETQKEILKIAQARFQYGAGSQLDVEQAKTALNSTLAAIPGLETQLRQLKNFLSVLLALPPGEGLDLPEGPREIPVSPPQVVAGIPADLLRRRPDIRRAELQAAAQCAQIGVAKADLYPAFSLSGSFGFLSTDIGGSKLSNLFQWGSRTYQIGPSFQWNILNYGQITNKVRVQDARFQDLLISYQNAVLTAQQEVEDSLIAFLRAQDRASFLVQSAAAARAALDLALRQYRGGVKDFTAVLIAEQTLLNEEDNLASTRGNIAGNLVGVYRALGGGWEIREDREIVPPEIREEMAKRTNWGELFAPGVNPSPDLEKEKSFIRSPDW